MLWCCSFMVLLRSSRVVSKYVDAEMKLCTSVFCFQVLNRRDSTCPVAAAQKLLPVVVQVSNQIERERETRLFRIHVTCSGTFSNASTVALRCLLATDSFIVSSFISSFISGRGEFSNIDAEWKCRFVECFQVFNERDSICLS